VERHAILAQGRSGSTYLRHVLHAHPHLANFGEVLGEWSDHYAESWPRNGDVATYLRQFFTAGPRVSALLARSDKDERAVRSVGIKEFFYNIERRKAGEFFARDPGIAIVYLHRRNLLRRYVSLLVQKETGVSNTGDAPPSIRPMRLPPPEVLKGLRVLEREREFEVTFVERLSRSHRLLPVVYEEYFAGDDAIERHNSEIFVFLAVPALSIRANLKKIVPVDMRAVIANYDEVCAALSGTKYASYLE
jgi:hypothetical protein